MNSQSQTGKKIHLSGLDEFFADSVLEEKEKPLKFLIHRDGDPGFISLLPLDTKECMEKEGIDFELSSCECAGLEGLEVSDFLMKPVFTSSAYEFFDFLLMFLDSFECLLDFTGNAWKIKILKSTVHER
jgi:hypothetical protein